MQDLDRDKLTSHLQGEREQTIGSMVLDAAKIAWNTNRPQVTNFMIRTNKRLPGVFCRDCQS